MDHPDSTPDPSDEKVEALLQELLPELRSFVRLRTGAALRALESVSDLVQSTCREILKHQNRYQHRGEQRFRYWLFTEAERKIKKRLAYHQAARRDPPGAVHSLQPDFSAPDDARLAAVYRSLSTPSRHVIAREEIERFEAAFEKLPEHHREVITLSYLVGLSHKEIAETMGRTELATRSLLHRALAELAEVLGPDG
jgi:RNA polymerase sigma-70 factor (ECF subfamily)